MHVGRSTGLAIAGLITAGTVGAVAYALTRNEDELDPSPVPEPLPAPPTTAPSMPTPTPTRPSTTTPEPPPTTTVPAPTPPSTVPSPTVVEPPPPSPTVPPAPVDVPSDPPARTFEYAVQGGDTLSSIARRFDTTVATLVQLNDIADPDRIRVGQRLRVPGRAPATPAPTTPAPTTPAPSTPAPTTPSSGSQPAVPAGGTISRVPGARGKVALTFDDGPNGAYTDAILATLDRRGVDATFFVVGTQAARNGASLVRMRDAGHAIANHSWSHPQLTSLDDGGVRREFTDTSDAIERATGSRPDIFRPPYGARNDRVDRIAAELGMRDVLWDVDTVDWSRPGTAAIVDTAVGDARDGSVILLHDGGGDRQQTVDALERIITGLEGRGFELVTVPELVAAG